MCTVDFSSVRTADLLRNAYCVLRPARAASKQLAGSLNFLSQYCSVYQSVQCLTLDLQSQEGKQHTPLIYAGG